MALIECVPNVSEGRRPDVIDALAAAVLAVAGVHLLDQSSDPRTTVRCSPSSAKPSRSGRRSSPCSTWRCARSTCGLTGRSSAPWRRRRRAVHSDQRRNDGGLCRARPSDGGRRRRHGSRSRCSCTRRPPRQMPGAISRTSGAANSKGWQQKMARRSGRLTSARPGPIRPPAPRSSAPGRRSSPSTSTSQPTDWRQQRRSPPPSGTAAADSPS